MTKPTPEQLCSCVHSDPDTCADWRSNLYTDDPNYSLKHYRCQCICHSEQEDDEDDSP